MASSPVLRMAAGKSWGRKRFLYFPAMKSAAYADCLNSLGERPTFFLNIRLRWWGYLKPSS